MLRGDKGMVSSLSFEKNEVYCDNFVFFLGPCMAS